MINENSPEGNTGNPGVSNTPSQTPSDPKQKPSEVPQDPNEVQAPPPREIPPAPEPNEGDRERA